LNAFTKNRQRQKPKAVFYCRFEHDLEIARLTGFIVKSKNRFIVFKFSKTASGKAKGGFLLPCYI
jgi:hypothetical protein